MYRTVDFREIEKYILYLEECMKEEKIGPDPHVRYPLKGLLDCQWETRCCFLKNVVTNPNIIVGEYTYYDDQRSCKDFEKRNVLYLYPFSKEKLIMGKFCSIATDVEFLMSSANHRMDSFSTYPFSIFQRGWEEGFDPGTLPWKGDTVLHNDIWLGYDATIMPGVTIGDGAIVGAKSVVTRDVEPYTIVGGNPARIIRKRFDDDTIQELLRIKWWDWSIETISKNVLAISDSDLDALRAIADRQET